MILNWLLVRVLGLLYRRVKGSNIMLHRYDHFIYLDVYGNIWNLKLTHDPSAPFSISLLNRT